MNKFLIICLLCMLSSLVGAQDLVFRKGKDVSIFMPSTDEPVSETAFQMLASDIEKVLDAELVRVNKETKAHIVAALDASMPREGFRLQVEDGKLLIHGADAHGLAYGLLEVSRLIGVSPWEWWADCTPYKANVFLRAGYSTEQSPAVAYRGIFINDEDWGILPWSGGVIGPETNERIFQLMLRLRANYYWPAMHEVSQPFFTIPGNREMAHKYGIYIGGSHCEPMATSPAKEWEMRGVGDYNYVTNSEAVKNFWQERLEEVKGQDIVYTIGMRGLHDGSMQGTKTKEDKLRYLQQAIDDQREMLRSTVNVDVASVPQVFVPYKEVLDIYRSGLQVPDDVTLMWTDDNYGYIRHFPDSMEQMRAGGNGLYYHVSYWGRPHDYLWLGTFSPFLMRQQLTEAYQRGIRQMWVLNVGDIKPAEYLIEDFLNMAWKGLRGRTDGRQELQAFFKREFGEELADTITSVMVKHYQLAFDRKPEHMGGTRVEEADRAHWNIFRPIEGWSSDDVEQRVKDYRYLSDIVEALSDKVPAARRDAYFQLVKYPVQAAAQMNFKFLSKQSYEQAYDSIVSLTHIYNSNPKWEGIMNMAPRKLAVFNRVQDPLVYPEEESAHFLFNAETWQHVSKGDSLVFVFESDAKKITLDVRLLPTHPIEEGRLSFSVSLDGTSPIIVDFQTYDRSEEWKQNVLRNYAHRTFVLPLSGNVDGGTRHSLVFRAVTEGVYLRQVSFSPAP